MFWDGGFGERGVRVGREEEGDWVSLGKGGRMYIYRYTIKGLYKG